MAWWQLGALLVLSTAAASWLLLLRARLAASSSPERSAPVVPIDPETLAECVAAVKAVRAEWRAERKELDAYFEALEEESGTVERKRRRIAGAESRRKKAEETETEQATADPNSREAIRARARAQGYLI